MPSLINSPSLLTLKMMLPKLAALLLLLLLAAEASAAERKLNLLKKLFKKDPKKCDIIWTEKIWPECTVTQEKVGWRLGLVACMSCRCAGRCSRTSAPPTPPRSAAPP